MTKTVEQKAKEILASVCSESVEALEAHISSNPYDAELDCGFALEAIRIALQTEQKFDAWSPIESAPKNGITVLAYNDAWPAIYPIYWNGGCWELDDMRYSAIGLGPYNEPTHWMPMLRGPL